MTLKNDLFGPQNDLEMTFKVKIFSGIHPIFTIFFTAGKRRTFPTKCNYYFPPHLNCVVALLWEFRIPIKLQHTQP